MRFSPSWICVLLGLSASSAGAGIEATLWVQGTDGGDQVDVQVSETAVIQLWLSVEPGVTLISVSAVLLGYDQQFGADHAFEVQGFNDITIANSLLQRTSRGSVEDDIPHGVINDYQYVGSDNNLPFGASSGLPGPRTVLLDEIIIHGIIPQSMLLPTTNPVNFPFPDGHPSAFQLNFSPFPPPGQWTAVDATLALGTGHFSNRLSINVVPEPAGLAMLAYGAVIFGRRKRTGVF